MTANSLAPGRCVRHGGVEPCPALSCPDCGRGSAAAAPGDVRKICAGVDRFGGRFAMIDGMLSE
ncbi:MAG: hypothetical protein M3422_27250 [Actinomycetota bacterium]|nr:hypothetical protein [Actinomycetota bacterium]